MEDEEEEKDMVELPQTIFRPLADQRHPAHHQQFGSSRPYSREDFSPDDGESSHQQPHKKRKLNEVGNQFLEKSFQQHQQLQQEQRDQRGIPPTGVDRTVRVSRGQLSHAMKSKLDMYNVLAIEGQLYLPPYQHCSMLFLRDVMSGKKKVRR